MNKKKLMSLILAGTLLSSVGLYGCSKDSDESAKPQVESQEIEAEKTATDDAEKPNDSKEEVGKEDTSTDKDKGEASEDVDSEKIEDDSKDKEDEEKKEK